MPPVVTATRCSEWPRASSRVAFTRWSLRSANERGGAPRRMSAVLRWILATLIGLVAVVGLIAFLNSRDQGGVDQANAGPGSPYHGQPALSPALAAAVKRGN